MIAYNKKTKQLTEVEHSFMLKPVQDWAINPLISDRNALMVVSTDKWVYEEDTTVLRPMTELELDTNPLRLLTAKNEKMAVMNQHAKIEITGGFWSSATGASTWYDSSQEDQLNMTSALLASAPSAGYPNGINMFYASRIAKGEEKQYSSHSYLHLRQIAVDGTLARSTILQKFNSKCQGIQAASTVSQVNAITWGT